MCSIPHRAVYRRLEAAVDSAELVLTIEYTLVGHPPRCRGTKTGLRASGGKRAGVPRARIQRMLTCTGVMMPLLTLGAHAQRGLRYLVFCPSTR